MKIRYLRETTLHLWQNGGNPSAKLHYFFETSATYPEKIYSLLLFAKNDSLTTSHRMQNLGNYNKKSVQFEINIPKLHAIAFLQTEKSTFQTPSPMTGRV